MDRNIYSILSFWKKVWEESGLISIFQEKCFLFSILLPDQNFVSWLPLFLEIMANLCIAIVCFPSCDVANFEINLICQIKLFFYTGKKRKPWKNLQCLQNKRNDLIDTTKCQYYTRISKKPMDPTTSAKTNWSILKRCLYDKNILCIPSLFHYNNFITYFQQKTELFSSFLSKFCSITDSGSKLTSNKKIILTKNYLSSHLIM